MPLDPLSDPLLRAPRSHVPTIPAMTEAAAAATPEQLADFVDAIGAAGGGGGGGGGGGNATNLGVAASPTGVTVTSDSGTDAEIPLADGTNAGLMAPAQVTKLASVATGATANATDAQLRDRATHTGTQAISTVTGLQAALDGKATLVGGKLDPSQVPDIALQQYLGAVANEAAMLALAGQLGDWCTRSDTGTDWRIVGNPTTLAGWLQTAYPSAPVVSVAGKTGAVTLAKGDVGLGNVDNTSDANKPVSTAQAAAIGAKMDATLPALQSAFDAGTAAQKATFRDSVSGAVNLGPVVMGLFGDSRTYYSHVTDGGTLGVTYPAQETATTRDDISANGLAHHMQVASGGAIICPRRCNFGIHGEKTDAMLARAPAAAAAMRAAGATRVLMLLSTNDRSVAPTLTAAQSIANISGIVGAFVSAGLRVSIVAELPRGDSTYTAFRLTDAQYRDHMRVRRHILGMHNNRDVLVADAWTDVANLASTSGDIRAGYTYDGIHLAGVAAARIARRVWAQVATQVAPYRAAPSGVRDTWNTDNPGASIVFNPNMTGTAGTLGSHTGVIADAWTGGSAITNLTITGSKVTDALGVEAQQFVIAGTVAPPALATTDLMRQDRNIGTQGLAIGGRVRAVGEIEIDGGAAGIRDIDVYVAAGTMSARAGGGAANAADTIMSTDAHAGWFATEAITIPAGATAVRTGVRLMVGGAATTGATVRVKWMVLEHVA